jgi:menaquinol-cytochrome c reductase iron-sulfur subunit
VNSGRRNFMAVAIQGLGAIIGAALAIPALVYLFAPGRKQAAGAWVDIGDIAKFADGAVAEVVFRRKRVDGWKVVDEKLSAWVVKDGGQPPFAVSPICTHLGCAVNWNAASGEFRCPCHTSSFSRDGKVIAGPAPRTLDRYATRVVNGKLQIGGVVRSEG